MSQNNDYFQTALYYLIEESISINAEISSKKIDKIELLKSRYIELKNRIEKTVPKNLSETIEKRPVQCYKELMYEFERAYALSLQLYKSNWWGEFSKITPKRFPELSTMMLDQGGDLLRSFDDFNGTVGMMDFHGYTQFSKDIKYNKTPLQEFGNVLPQKIEQICNICRCIIYEVEGDALIIIGPENPIYIVNAVLCIIELCRQKPFNPDKNPKLFHQIEIKNPMIKPFEMNAAITTGGRVFINNSGRIIGSLISEASRILKIINTKKPNKSGIILNEKVYRKLDKFRDTQTGCHINAFNFSASDSFFVDVKGTRLNIREIFLEEKKYLDDTKEFTDKLTEEIKKKHVSKWHNILSYYLNLVLACINDLKVNIQIGSETHTPEKIRNYLKIRFYEWISTPSPDTINDILKVTSLLYESSEEVRDITAIFHEYIQENYSFIAKRLEDFYRNTIRKVAAESPTKKKVIDFYENEMQQLREKFPAKRLIENLFSNEKMASQLKDVPYLGKK